MQACSFKKKKKSFNQVALFPSAYMMPNNLFDLIFFVFTFQLGITVSYVDYEFMLKYEGLIKISFINYKL